jgi:gluconate 2-dehydrogenase
MSKPKVLVARNMPEAVDAYISEHCEMIKWPSNATLDNPEYTALLQDVQGIMISGLKVDEQFLSHAPHLKIVSNIGVGYNTLDTAAMKARGVLGTNTPYVLDDTVADLVFALILSSARRVPELDAFVKMGNWKRGEVKSEDLFGLDVHHTTLGIIGMGRIGEAIVKRAVYGFDMNVVYHNRRPKPEVEQKYGIAYRSLEDLLRESDFVLLMTPLTAETTRMIRKEHFEMMKRTAFFINASRGQTVDEGAMIEALEQGLIRGAGLDVFEQEPVDPNNPLLRMANVVTLPHIGSATTKTRADMAMRAAKNLVAGVTGAVPEDVVEEHR